LGRGRGGFGTEPHAAVNPPGHPVRLHLSRANAADSPHLPALIAGVKTAAAPADKGYDADSNRRAVRRQGAEPCIPPRENRTTPIEYDRHRYEERNGVGRFFARIKQDRRVATRYDKKARNFLGFVWVATIGIVLA
jgi:transposase